MLKKITCNKNCKNCTYADISSSTFYFLCLKYMDYVDKSYTNKAKIFIVEVSK